MTMLPAFSAIAQKAERSFSIWGPNSGGGQSVLLVEGMLYDVVYGDESRLPGGAEQVISGATPGEYAARVGNDPRHAAVLAYLREHGLLAPS